MFEKGVEMIFEIPLANGKIVYMKGEESEFYSIVVVDTDKFLKFWDPDESKVHLPKDAPKYVNASLAFEQSREYPVPLSEVGGPLVYKEPEMNFRMVDGTTRLQYLIDNGVSKFPVYIPPSSREWFLANICS